MKYIIFIFMLIILSSCNPYIQHFKNLTIKNGILDRHDHYVNNDKDLQHLPQVKEAFLAESESYRITAKKVLNENE